MAINTLLRAIARILASALVGGGAVLAGVSPAAAATPWHAVGSPAAVDATGSPLDRPSTCPDGIAWGESSNGYRICVSRTGEPASQPESEPTSSEKDGKVDVVYEVTGSGTADAVTIDHGTLQDFSNVELPFSRTSRVPADIDLLQVHVSGSHDSNTACRIILDGTVVVTSPNGDCVFTR
jgi:hypothetical protein